MVVVTKPSETMPTGWVKELMEVGCVVRWKPGPFGRALYLTKKDGEAIEMAQDKYRAMTTPLDQLSETQKTIVDLIMTTGIVKEQPKKNY